MSHRRFLFSLSVAAGSGLILAAIVIFVVVKAVCRERGAP